VAADERVAYIQEREEIEIAAVYYVHRQYLIRNTDKDATKDTVDEILENYSSTEHWLLRRTGIANTRRKQQFVYWREHVLRLNRMRAESPNRENEGIHSTEKEPAQSSSLLDIKVTIPVNPKPAIPLPSTTTATKLKKDFLKPGDLKSVISHQTRVSTAISSGDGKLEWPEPQKVDIIGGYFICTYCKTLCPREYLRKTAWV
jgi:hypothetical protein